MNKIFPKINVKFHSNIITHGKLLGTPGVL